MFRAVEEFETATFAAMKKAVAQGSKIKVVMSSADRRRGRKEEAVDLRDLITKSRVERNQERKG